MELLDSPAAACRSLSRIRSHKPLDFISSPDVIDSREEAIQNNATATNHVLKAKKGVVKRGCQRLAGQNPPPRLTE
jgi:hypothetical protein